MVAQVPAEVRTDVAKGVGTEGAAAGDRADEVLLVEHPARAAALSTNADNVLTERQ
jgi:hypothetical protein